MNIFARDVTIDATKIKLRDYQKEAVQNVLDAIKVGIKRPAVVLATGGGKTVVMASLIPQLKLNYQRRKVLVLAHKEELIRQTHYTISKMNPGLNVQIDMQRSIPTSDADIIVGSVMTLVRLSRLHRYNPLEFGAIVLDECHHAVAASWKKILNHFGSLDASSDILTIGFTATLERTDGKQLGQIFDSIVFERTLRTMVEKKELCDVKFSTIKVDMSLEGVRKSMGDYDTSLLSRVVNIDNVNLKVVRAYLQLRRDLGFRSTLIFCVDIDHCKTLCGILQANAVNAQYVTGETIKYERKAILEDFKNGKIDVLCNVLVFTEGTDIPNIDSLILARPTRSRPLLVQMIGRGLRLYEGKQHCHVVDLVSTVDVGVLSVPTLFGVEDFMNIEGKSLLQLEKELEEIKLRDCSADVDVLFEVQQKLKSLDLEFDTIDGFAEVERAENQNAQDIKSTNKAFRQCGLNWIRLEYNLWALPVPFADHFFSIERVVDKEGKITEFKLFKLHMVAFKVLVASKFKAKRKSDTIITSGSLSHVLSVASNNSSKFNRGNKKQDVNLKRLTDKQSEWLIRKLSGKVLREYGNKVLAHFKSLIRKMEILQASDLIFALKYSINSLLVRWEVDRIMKSKDRDN